MFGSNYRNGNQSAFTLLEILVSLCLSTIVLASALRVWVTMEHVELSSLKSDEVQYMWMSMERVLAENIHSAKSASILFGQLSLGTDNGTMFQYYVNGRGEFIRVTSGGGSAVIATRVKTVVVTLASKVIQVTATFNNGDVDTMAFSMLTAI